MPVFEKTDRGARLLRTLLFLVNNGRGLTVVDIAKRNSVSTRTAQRDLETLSGPMNVPIYQEGARWVLMDGYLLQPLDLELDEAMAIFLSVRLMARHSDAYDVHVGSALSKLAAILEPPISQYVEATAGELASHPHHPDQSRIFSLLTAAWANRREVVIKYPSHGRVADRRVRIYFLEPSAAARSTYLVGWDVEADAMRHFKVERIAACEISEETFEIPRDFDPASYFAPSWGIMHADPVKVELRFAPDAAGRVAEARWHPSQKLENETGGWLHFEVTVAGTLEILPWILSWGASVEVLEPPELRNEVALIARRLSTMYVYDAPLRPPPARPAEESSPPAEPELRPPGADADA